MATDFAEDPAKTLLEAPAAGSGPLEARGTDAEAPSVPQASSAGPFPNPTSLPDRPCSGWAGCVKGSCLSLPYSSPLFVSPSRLGTPEQGRLSGSCSRRRLRLAPCSCRGDRSAGEGRGAARDLGGKKTYEALHASNLSLHSPPEALLGAALFLILRIRYGWLRSSESPKRAEGEGAPSGENRQRSAWISPPAVATPISFCKLLQSEGGEIAGACAIRCHFPLAHGGPGEAAAPRDIFTGSCFLQPIALFWQRSDCKTIVLIHKTAAFRKGFPVLLI